MNMMCKVIADLIKRIQNWRSVETKSNSATAQGIKLNIFQKGILSLILIILTVIIILASGQFFSSWIFISYIKNSSIAMLCAYAISSSVILVSICLMIINIILKINLAWPVTLPKSIEFSHALRNLRIFELDEQIRFVINQKIDVFMSNVEIPKIYKNNIRARKHGNFSDKEKIENLNGGHRLCFNADEYEQLVQGYKQHCSIEESVVLMEKEQELYALKMTISHCCPAKV
jgi:hypothetical protein